MDPGAKVISLPEIYAEIMRSAREDLESMGIFLSDLKVIQKLSLLKPAPDLFDTDLTNNRGEISSGTTDTGAMFPPQIVAPPGSEIPESMLERVTLSLPCSTSKLVENLVAPNLIASGFIQRAGSRSLLWQFLLKRNRSKPKQKFRVVPASRATQPGPSERSNNSSLAPQPQRSRASSICPIA